MADKENSYEIMSDPQGYFKPGERKSIYNACISLRDKVLIRLLWSSGRRVGEILCVRVDEINIKNKEILWHIEKKSKKLKENGKDVLNEKGRPIRVKVDLKRMKPIDDWTCGLLKYYIEEYGLKAEDYLFKSIGDKPISRQRAFQIVRKSCERAGVHFVGSKKPHPHHFRHSLAVDLARKMTSPADVRKLQQVLEHANLGMTEQYLQFGNQEIRDLMNELDPND